MEPVVKKKALHVKHSRLPVKQEVWTCETVSCNEPSTRAYVWPGQPIGFYCEACANRAAALAMFMGFHLHILPAAK